jgi:hypothetical protein
MNSFWEIFFPLGLCIFLGFGCGVVCFTIIFAILAFFGEDKYIHKPLHEIIAIVIVIIISTIIWIYNSLCVIFSQNQWYLGGYIGLFLSIVFAHILIRQSRRRTLYNGH